MSTILLIKRHSFAVDPKNAQHTSGFFRSDHVDALLGRGGFAPSSCHRATAGWLCTERSLPYLTDHLQCVRQLLGHTSLCVQKNPCELLCVHRCRLLRQCITQCLDLVRQRLRPCQLPDPDGRGLAFTGFERDGTDRFAAGMLIPWTQPARQAARLFGGALCVEVDQTLQQLFF